MSGLDATATPLLLAALTGLAAVSAGLFGAAHLARNTGGKDFESFQLRYQAISLTLACAVLAAAGALAPSGWSRFARMGEIGAPAGPVSWLGIAPSESWLEVGLSLGFIITVATCGFLVVQTRRNPLRSSSLGRLAPFILAAALANAFTEEAIYRLAPAVVLHGLLPPSVIAILSATGFGVAHYGGTPGGPVGVLMAGFLGWILARSLLETGGMFWPVAIHGLQDLVIMTFLAVDPALQRSRRMSRAP